MNLGHYEGDGDHNNWYLGLESVKRRTMQVVFAPYGAPLTELLPPRRIPNNRWFQVDLHFVLSPVAGDALTEWYMDGKLIGSTTASNMYNAKPLTFFNAGVSYFWPGNGGTTVFFDDPKLTYQRPGQGAIRTPIGTGEIGPVSRRYRATPQSAKASATLSYLSTRATRPSRIVHSWT